MSYVAIIGAVVGAGTSIYSGMSAKSAADKQQGAIGGTASLINRASVGGVPKPAAYTPVDFNGEQWNAIMRDKDYLGAITQLTSKTNNNIAKEDLRQANTLIPGYSSSMTRLGTQANDLIQGRLPDDVIQAITADRAGKSSGVNIPGLAGPATLKDLGLSSLDAVSTGTGLLGKMTQMAEQISPASQRINPQAFFQTPQQNIENRRTENELIQQSQQNANNLEAQPDPVASGKLRLALGQALQPNTGGAAVGQGIAQGGQGIAALLGRLGSSGGGSGTGGYNAAGWDAAGTSSTGFYKDPTAFNAANPTYGQYKPVYATSPAGLYYTGYSNGIAA